MKGFLHVIVPEDFGAERRSPSTRELGDGACECERFELVTGRDALATYTFNTHTAKHHFCKTCGIHAFYEPRSHPGHVDVNARCLDDNALRLFTIKPFDGRNWEASVSSIR